MLRLSGPAGLLKLAALLALAACGAPTPPPAQPSGEDAAPFNVDGDGVNDVRIGNAETGDPNASVATAGDDHGGDDHDDAGGEAHVHGLADLAVTLDGNVISAQIVSPLANFGVPEADAALPDAVITSLPGLISLAGGDCTPAPPVAAIDTSSGHTDAVIDFSWTCQNPAAVTAFRFDGFAAYPGFETVNAVFLGGMVQKAAGLTASSPELPLN